MKKHREVKRNVWSVVIGLLVLLGISSSSLEASDVTLAKKISHPPKIDGKLDDVCWTEATKLTGFKDSLTNKPAQEQTISYIGYDEVNLYIAFKCKESQMDKLKATIKKRDGKIWGDDCVEIFLDTNHDCLSYYHFAINSLNTQVDRKCELYLAKYEWNANWESATSQGKDYWIGEASIPFKELGISAPSEGTVWNLNLCREEKPKGENSSWTYVGKQFNSPHRFGNLVFGNYAKELQPRLMSLKKQLDNIKKTGKSGSDISLKTAEALEYISDEIKLLDKKIKEVPLTGERWAVYNGKIAGLSKEITKAGLTGKKYVICYKNPMIALTPSDFPSSTDELKELNISCYINEYRSTAFVLTNLTEQAIPVRVVFDEIVNRENKRIISPYELITLRIASFIQRKVQRKDGKIIINDVLPLVNEAQSIILPPKEPRQIWLTIETKDIAPGKYQGNIFIKPHYGAKEKVVKLNLTVHPVEISRDRHVKVMIWRSHTPDGYKTYTWETMKRYRADLVKSHTNAVPIMSAENPRPVYRDGKLIEPLEKTKLRRLDEWIPFWREADIFLIFPARFGTRGTCLLAGECTYTYRPPLLEPFGPEWNRVARIWIKALVEHLKEQGLTYDDFAFESVHEAAGTERAKWNLKGLKLIKEVDSKIKTITVGGVRTTANAKKMAPYIDIWLPNLNNLEILLPFLKTTGKPIWFYTCNDNCKTLSPLQYYRANPWTAWKYRIDGCGFWGYTPNSWEGDPWDDFDRSRTDSITIYDDPTHWAKGPIPSRRWEAFREGLEDYEYLYILNRASEEAKTKGIDTSKANHLLKRFDYEIYYSSDPDDIYRFKEEVAFETVRLLEKAASFATKKPEAKIKDKEATITWQSDRPCTGRVYYLKERGEEHWVAAIWSTVDSSTLSVNPSIKLINLAPGNYIFYTSSTNDMGYVMMDDNKGKGYRFTIEK